MNRDTLDFIAAMKRRGTLARFAVRSEAAATVLVGGKVKLRKDHNEGCRLRAERKRRAAGCRVYRQPFKGKLPERSDPGYRTVYMRLVRAAKKGNKL